MFDETRHIAVWTNHGPAFCVQSGVTVDLSFSPSKIASNRKKWSNGGYNFFGWFI